MLLIVTPLQTEFEALALALKEQVSGNDRLIGRLPTIDFPGLGFCLARGGHGKVQFAVHTQYLLERTPKVRSVICAGVAGALDVKLKFGEIVLASETIEHDYKERFDRMPLPRFPGDPKLLSSLKVKKFSSGLTRFRIHVGIIASGDEDIISPKRARQLRRETKAIAVAWEGAGCARVCRFYEKRFLEVRSITDHANASSSSDFKTHLIRAMRNIAALLTARIENAGAP